MGKDYDHKKIEKKWQSVWVKKKLYKTSDKSKKPKFYVLDMFPYPSGEGLHVGHPKGYIATDVISRMKRMQGMNVLHPMGFDAFGLPAENFAIKNKVHPEVAVKKNIKRFKEQLGIIGLDYDWSREVNTTDPKYYKWTQWIFLKLLEKGLAYESQEPINWCPSCKTGLANEDLEAGKCERCGSVAEKKPLRQWVLRITDYADRLLDDLKLLDKWPEPIKEMQANWIGKSEGAEIEFIILNSESRIKVFTTRPDTIFGATFLVVAPEIAKKLTGKDFGIKVDEEKENKEKVGKDTGLRAVNPANQEEIPVWVANYVSADYGTGAIMAVPADDERDREFAEKYNLKIVDNYPKAGFEDFGKKTTQYKLRDWVFSRQRYWGEPIPVIHCTKCGVVPVPEKDLPVKLPKVKSYEPTGTGESPLAGIEKWVNVKCPKCKGKARRETNTMPQWAGSSWYYLRYMDPKNSKVLVEKDKEKYWNSVDVYVGGAEHATRHLIYARFWHKFLQDIGVVSTAEPFNKLQSVGLIMGPDGRKMSKRFGNIINPDDIVGRFGADTLRIYEMFMGPFDQAISWSDEAIIGPRRFLERVWKLSSRVQENYAALPSLRGLRHGRNFPVPAPNSELPKLLNQTIKKVTEDIEAMRFNTAISAMMIFVNEVEKNNFQLSTLDFITFLKLLAPFAPHITEELWSGLGQKGSIHVSAWPAWDEGAIIESEIKIIIQVNGKLRGEMIVPASASEEEVKALALAQDFVLKYTNGHEEKKTIYVKGKLVNVVV